ncbi:MAG: hypothetical protein LCH37_08360 [Bacteroidetes bacterium]|nr:hypothetical protein [Bacteroidota bacterium]
MIKDVLEVKRKEDCATSIQEEGFPALGLNHYAMKSHEKSGAQLTLS